MSLNYNCVTVNLEQKVSLSVVSSCGPRRARAWGTSQVPTLEDPGKERAQIVVGVQN